ncbi:MAG: tol-pal system protein YbgF [bacterium]
MRLPWKILACLLLAWAASGCYGKKIYEMETVLDLQGRQIKSMQDTLLILSKEVAYFDSIVGRSSAPFRAEKAMFETKIQELQTRIEILESLVRENRSRLSQVPMGTGTLLPESRIPTESSDTMATSSAMAMHLYQVAYGDFVKGNFQSAINGFKDFLARFPQTSLSDDAQFMIGQSFFALGKHQEAIDELRLVLDNYPLGDRVPETIFKLAICYEETGDSETAKNYLQILINRYPGTLEAKQAEEKLKVMSRGR